MKKGIIIILAILLLVGCKGGAQSSLPNQENMEPRVKIFNQDSTYLKEIEQIIASSEMTFEEKQVEILLNIVSHYMKREAEHIKRLDRAFCDNIPTYIIIRQDRDFSDKRVFSLFTGNSSILRITEPIIGDKPTRIVVRNGRFVLIYFENEERLPIEKIPDFLHLENCVRGKREMDEYFILQGGTSWSILMCKNSFKHIVIMNVVHHMEFREYVADFSCD